jgi:hypothetical protein
LEPGRAWSAGGSPHRFLAGWGRPAIAPPTHSAVQVALVLAGPLDVSALRDALSGLIVQHQLLSAKVSVSGLMVLTDPVDQPEFTLPLLDLSAECRDRASADEIIATIIAEESLATFEPGETAGFRSWLVRLNQVDHILSLALHDRIAEQISPESLFSELPGRYAAARGGRRVPAAINGQPRPPGTRAPTTTIEFDIPGPTWAELRAAATSIGATAPTLLLAALADLLGRHTGQDHVMVGIPVRSRERPVPVRIDLSDRPAYIEIIKQLQAELAAAVRHGDADVGALLEAVEAGARTARPPEFQMMFDCLCEKDALYGAGQWEPGLRATVAYADPARARLDLTLQVNAGDGPVRVSLRYPTDLFSWPALRGAADELSTRLDAIAGEMAIGPTPCPAPAARSRSATV